MTTYEAGYYTIAEAARVLHVSEPTVWRWIDSGRLPAYRVGSRNIRIRRRDLGLMVRPARGGAMKDRTTTQHSLRTGDEKVEVPGLVERLRKGQNSILGRRDGQLLSPSARVIREAREERAARQ